ncbi:hypothetical protein N1851_012871 [Merluccius polli]|uniref:Uncharacterized protein n=1 Tax=Merluccius polli TaxID=89951 RepID=A0AA47MW07_MERPO|nr:hypothetical protein N1851_012871 [Merluccius polli]
MLSKRMTAKSLELKPASQARKRMVNDSRDCHPAGCANPPERPPAPPATPPPAPPEVEEEEQEELPGSPTPGAAPWLKRGGTAAGSRKSRQPLTARQKICQANHSVRGGVGSQATMTTELRQFRVRGIPVDLGARIVQGSLQRQSLSGQIRSLGIA